MNKQQALKIILDSSKLYKKNLENKKFLFIYKDKHRIKSIEMIFLPRNFLHLTGLDISNSQICSSIQFYNSCLKNKISINDFNFKKNGTSILKLQILPQVMQINKNAKMIGRYTNSKIYLSTDILIGTCNICIGGKKLDIMPP